jgi:phosphomethylpyrimidine synthase
MGKRRKAYLEGTRADVRVPVCEVELDPPNEAVRLYDTSGPGSDPHEGLEPLRAGWIHERGDVEHYAGRVAGLRDDGRASFRAGRSAAEPFPGAGADRPRLRAAAGRTVTQMHYARRGEVTPET